MAFAGRRGLRDALTPRIAAAGALCFGAVIVLQNAGIARTSVSHAAVVIGIVPILVALIAAGVRRTGLRGLSWGGYAIALIGIALVAGSGGGGATTGGDLLVLASSVVSASVIVVQPDLLAGRDPAAVTAVQLAAGGLVALPVALLSGSTPTAPSSLGPVLAFAALCGLGTLLAYWLFAVGQSRVRAEIAGAFVNLEPLVGAAAGWVAFGDTATVAQLAGAAAVLAGLALSTRPAPAPAVVAAGGDTFAGGERGRGRGSGRRAPAGAVSRACARAGRRAGRVSRRSGWLAGSGLGGGGGCLLPARLQRES
jgi:drug/metabolite transporter (DMT)-like permease